MKLPLRSALVALHDRALGWTPSLAGLIHRAADVVGFAPFVLQRRALPEPLRRRSGSPIDVVDDLAAYTHLPAAVIVRALSRRDIGSFRSEWHATPQSLRDDYWFYLSAKGYLFGNAAHAFATEIFDRLIKPNVRPGQRVLDFGAGVGSQTVGLALEGIATTATDLSALQRDFIRFRAHRHGLNHLVSVVDPWVALPHGVFRIILALDVLEHLPDCAATIEKVLLPALDQSGVIIENSPFGVDYRNPMHHRDFGLAAFLTEAGLTLVEELEDGTRAWRRGGDGDGRTVSPQV